MNLELPGDVAVMRAHQMQELDHRAMDRQADARGEYDDRDDQRGHDDDHRW